MHRLAAASLLLACALALPARADEWTDALVADLVEGNTKDALAKYEAVRTAGHAKALAASLRRLQLLARFNKKDELLKECETFAKAFPDAPALKHVEQIKAKPEAYIRAQSTGLMKRLKTQRISLNFDGTPLPEAIDFLRDITGISYLVLPDANLEGGSVTLQLKDVTLESALKLILAAGQDVEYRATMGLIVIGKDVRSVGPHKWTRAEVLAAPELAEKMLGRRVTLNFPGTPLSEVAQFLQDILGIPVQLDAEVTKADPQISVRVKDVSIESALAAILGPHGMDFVLTATGLRLRVKP